MNLYELHKGNYQAVKEAIRILYDPAQLTLYNIVLTDSKPIPGMSHEERCCRAKAVAELLGKTYVELENIPEVIPPPTKPKYYKRS